jgi:hypothetical protein
MRAMRSRMEPDRVGSQAPPQVLGVSEWLQYALAIRRHGLIANSVFGATADREQRAAWPAGEVMVDPSGWTPRDLIKSRVRRPYWAYSTPLSHRMRCITASCRTLERTEILRYSGVLLSPVLSNNSQRRFGFEVNQCWSRRLPARDSFAGPAP